MSIYIFAFLMWIAPGVLFAAGYRAAEFAAWARDSNLASSKPQLDLAPAAANDDDPLTHVRFAGHCAT
jgi:hypothetical protein